MSPTMKVEPITHRRRYAFPQCASQLAPAFGHYERVAAHIQKVTPVAERAGNAVSTTLPGLALWLADSVPIVTGTAPVSTRSPDDLGNPNPTTAPR